MEDFNEYIRKSKKSLGITYKDIADMIDKKEPSLRMALKRDSLSALEKREIKNKIEHMLHNNVTKSNLIKNIGINQKEVKKEHKKRELAPSQKEIDDFIDFLFKKRKYYEGNPFYQIFEKEIRTDERNKTMIEILKKKLISDQ